MARINVLCLSIPSRMALCAKPPGDGSGARRSSIYPRFWRLGRGESSAGSTRVPHAEPEPGSLSISPPQGRAANNKVWLLEQRTSNKIHHVMSVGFAHLRYALKRHATSRHSHDCLRSLHVCGTRVSDGQALLAREAEAPAEIRVDHGIRAHEAMKRAEIGAVGKTAVGLDQVCT